MEKDIIFTQVLQWWNKCFFLTIIRTSNIFIILQHWFIMLFDVLVTVKVIQFMKLFEIAEVVEITFKTITWEKKSRKRCYFYSVITMMKLQLTLKHYLLTDEKLFELFSIENDFSKYFAKCCNLFIYFYLAPYGNSSKWYISILLDKSNSLVFHNFMKCFSGTQVNQKVNKCFKC